MKKKDTDDIFRDKLNDFQEIPDPAVWDRIENSLNKRKRRGIIPIWWSLGGVAALVVLGVFLYTPGQGDSLPSEVSDQPAVVKQTQEESPNSINKADQNKAEQNKAEQDKAEQDNAPDDIISAEEHLEEGVAKNNPEAASDSNDIVVPDAFSSEPVTTSRNTAKAVAAQTTPRENAVASELTSESAVAIAKATDPEVAVAEEKDTEQGKISILDAAAEQEALSRNDDEFQNAEEKSRSWSVGPAVAPVFYSNFGNGSPLDPDFVPNSKSGTLNMSLGIAVSYAVTGKLSVRSGVHRVDFGYNTNQVSFSPTIDARPSSLIRTISYSESSRNVVVHSNVNGAGAQAIENVLDVSAQSPMRNGSMLQEFGYLEIPLEMQYALVEGKFGVNVIGGMSSLFLVNNSVSLDSSGSRTEIGEANNINPVNFSSNLGLGLYYNLNASMQLNLQPMFKYHMNAFSQTAGDFQPYTLGVYSGLSFRF